MDNKAKGVVIPTHDKASERKMFLLHKRTQREIEKAVIKQLRNGTSTVFLDAIDPFKKASTIFQLGTLRQRFYEKFLLKKGDKRSPIAQATNEIAQEMTRNNGKRVRKLLQSKDPDQIMNISETQRIDDIVQGEQLQKIVAGIEEWSEKIVDKGIKKTVKTAIEAVKGDQDINKIIAEIKKNSQKTDKQLKRSAEHMLSNLNSMVTRQRAMSSGIQKAIWVTRHDAKVRDAHKILDGMVFDLNKGCPKYADHDSYDGKVGPQTGEFIFPKQEYGCRCDYKLVLEDDDPFASLMSSTRPPSTNDFNPEVEVMETDRI